MEKSEAYNWAAKRIRAQVQRQVDPIATLANTAAILKEYFPSFFWVGFYFVHPDHLLLGPFQGPPACVRLARDKGVCATAAAQDQTILVADVHQFPGHVACDGRANSEIVVPVHDRTGSMRAVLDVDSTALEAFDQQDAAGLERIAELLREVWPAR
ncbi:MAG TPA: GAF domain-containing protein [bacterium]|nr:GAF domain-containing protein [bacterium]HPR86610.1 GAF domain-containing protein [bacterium]